MPNNKNKITSQSGSSTSSFKIYLLVLIGYIILSAFVEIYQLAISSLIIILITLFTYLGLKDTRDASSCIGAIVFFGLIGFFLNAFGSYGCGFGAGLCERGLIFVIIYVIYVVISILAVAGNGMKLIVKVKRS
jgi:hypothetical protein